MKVWTFDDPRSFGARGIVRGALQGMEEYGWTVHAPLLDPTAGIASLRDDLLAFSPDLLFFVNQPPDLYLTQMGFSPSEIQQLTDRRLVWILDDPFLLGRDPFNPQDSILVADPAFAETVRQRGGTRVSFLPVAADIETPGRVRDTFSSPVAYVGSVKNMEEWHKKVPLEFDQYLTRVIAEKLKTQSTAIDQILETMPLAPGRRVNLDGPLAYYLYVMANNQFRIDLLEALIPYGLQLFGGGDWPALLRDSCLRTRYRGALDPVSETPDLYRSASVSINLRSLQGFTAPTQRDFNVPAAGGFLLSSDLGTKPTDVCRAYWAGIKSLSFTNRDEMLGKVRESLASPQRRLEWTESVQEVIQHRHRYVHRVDRIAEFLKT
ncbi:MAG: glycosyltransferase [bacterium]